MTQPQDQPEVQIIQPQPMPETWTFDVLPSGQVVVQIHGVSGIHVSFLAADAAVMLGEKLTSTGRQAKTGLILLPPGTMPPPPPNGNHN